MRREPGFAQGAEALLQCHSHPARGGHYERVEGRRRARRGLHVPPHGRGGRFRCHKGRQVHGTGLRMTRRRAMGKGRPEKSQGSDGCGLRLDGSLDEGDLRRSDCKLRRTGEASCGSGLHRGRARVSAVTSLSTDGTRNASSARHGATKTRPRVNGTTDANPFPILPPPFPDRADGPSARIRRRYSKRSSIPGSTPFYEKKVMTEVRLGNIIHLFTVVPRSPLIISLTGTDNSRRRTAPRSRRV